MESCVRKIKKDIELTKGSSHTIFIILTPKPSDGDVSSIIKAIEAETTKKLTWWPSNGWFSYEPDRL